ncbi:MAG: metal-sulfur cluster assembly factor [Planctomycetota bacterium]
MSTPESPPTAPAPDTRDLVIEAIRGCFDPEIPVNIYDLGLVYEVKVEGTKAYVKMTLTSPACPVAGTLPIEVKNRVEMVEGIENAEIDLVWDPPWTPAKLSEAARLQLGM